jgi:hypothetical protein
MSSQKAQKINEELAHAFAKEVCLGNRDAEKFCELFFQYAHGLDDLLDCKEDGRPTMSNDDILGLFATAAMMYGCPFWLRHQSVLFPCILLVHNMYCDSVAWEREPLEHRRVMADAMRTCGDEIFNMVALLCGGYHHMRRLSPRIREVDYLRQHNPDGTPN